MGTATTYNLTVGGIVFKSSNGVTQFSHHPYSGGTSCASTFDTLTFHGIKHVFGLFAASESLRATLFGAGGHGSRPVATVDPVVMAAATVMRLQTLVSREVAGTDTAVVTVGALNAGTTANIIPDSAEMLLNVRSYDDVVRRRLLEGIERVVRAEATASRAPREPEVVVVESAPAVVNEPDAVELTRGVLESVVGAGRVVDPGPVTGSEDVGVLATAAGAPLLYWLLGGADPAAFSGATTAEELVRVVAGLPSNHSPRFAPVEDPTLRVGVAALVAAATEWLSTVSG